MNDITIFQLTRMAERGQPLPENWWSEYIDDMRKPWERAVDSGTKKPQHLQLFDTEAFGNPCPLCGRTPEPVKSAVIIGEMKLGEYTRYNPVCNCAEDFETQMKEKHKFESRLDIAEIPEEFMLTEWDDWDSSVAPELTASHNKIKGFRSGSCLNDLLSKGMILFGGAGRGKTMTAMCFLKSVLTETNKSVKYIPMADLATRMINSGQDKDYAAQIEKLDVLFLDDLDKLSSKSEWVQERVFSIIDHFHRSHKCLILTTNLENFIDLTAYFGPHSEAIISRLVDRMEWASFKSGEDYRKIRRKKNSK